MDTTKIKEIGKWLMVAGGFIFSAGAGTYCVGNHIDKKEIKKKHFENMCEIEEQARVKEIELKDAALTAAAEKDRLYTEKIKNMNQKEFAKFHAENVAKANEDIINEANRIKKEAEAEIVKIRMECNDKINSLRTDCLTKIEDANNKRDEAMEKYDAINTLFTNKDRILEAEAALKQAIEDEEKNKSNKDELIKYIKDTM